MTIRVEWDDEASTIIRHCYEKGWTLDDYHRVVDLTSEMSRSVRQCVDVISDFTDSKTSPVQLMSASRHIEQKLPPYPSISVAINPPAFVKVIVEVMMNLAHSRGNNSVTVRFARSLDEARTIIRDYRATVVRQSPI